MFKRIIPFIVAVLPIVAHAQTVTVPSPSTYSVVLSWTAPAGCTTAAPCTYAVYRLPGTVTISAGTTGATLVTTTASQVVSATDATVAQGLTYSYAVETIQGGATSAPSNTVNVTIPNVPSAPTVIIVTVAPH